MSHLSQSNLVPITVPTMMEDLIDFGEKSEAKTWNRVHVTSGPSFNCPPRARHVILRFSSAIRIPWSAKGGGVQQLQDVAYSKNAHALVWILNRFKLQEAVEPSQSSIPGWHDFLGWNERWLEGASLKGGPPNVAWTARSFITVKAA